jgi:LmbE family N-acetylglucosaminyl deacetylase
LTGRPLAGRTVLGIFAHPDDESLACGGTFAKLADAGARVVLLCASRGEGGSISDPALVPDGDLGRVREGELRDACAVLGISDVIVMDLNDGTLRWKDEPKLLAEIDRCIREYRPDAVITFAEDGLYWHLDHIGVFEKTFDALEAIGAAAPPLYYVTMPHGAMRAVTEAAHTKGGAPANANPWGIPPDAFGLHAEPPSLIVDVRPWVPRKLAALRCHRTQMGANNPLVWIDETEARQWLGVENFRRSPLPNTGQTILEQLGEPVPQ